MNKIKTIFIGTSEFAVPILEKLVEIDFIDVVCVITQPDRPVGRKQKMQSSPVKLKVKSYKLKVGLEQPESIRKVADELLEKYKPELIIVASYGQIIPKKILNYPKYGALNVHGSLLPDLRGAVPIQMAVLNGYEQTGVTLQKMVFKMDAGGIITNYELRIKNEDTYESLSERLSRLAAENLEGDLKKWISGEIEALPQDETLATYCYITDTKKEKAEIKENTGVELAERMTRAFYPWPVAWFKVKSGKYEGKRVKVFNAIVRKSAAIDSNQKAEIREQKAGQLLADSGKLYLYLKDGMLELKEIQLEGKDKRKGSEYLWLTE